MSPLPAEERPQPKSLTDLFISFTLLALQGFGGVLAIVQRELVEKKRWMTREEFIEDWAVAQIMPGPNVVNLSLMVGGRYFGLKGAMAALAGMLTRAAGAGADAGGGLCPVCRPPRRGGRAARHGRGGGRADRRDRPQAFRRAQENVLGLRLCIGLGVLCFVAIALLRIPLAYVLLSLGVTACVLAYRRLKP
jgi:chromate transporter